MTISPDQKPMLNWFESKPKTIGAIVFTLMLAIVIVMVYQRYELLNENQKREMTTILHVVHSNLDQSLNNSEIAAITLALTIDEQGKPQNFEEISRQILKSNSGLDVLQLVPDGVIRHIYPLHGNEAALGLDIINSPVHRSEALKSLKSNRIYFSGPFQLKQGGLGIVGRHPVYKGDKFWGFSAVVIRLETLLEVSGINTLNDSQYYFQISKQNPVTKEEEFFLPIQEDFSDKFYEVRNFPESDFKLYIVVREKYALYWMLLPLTVFGIVLAGVFGFLIMILLRKPAELQSLVNMQAAELTKQDAKFKTIFEHASIGITEIDSETGKFINANEYFVDLSGFSPEQLSGMKIVDLFEADDPDQPDPFQEVVNGNVKKISIQRKIINSGGDRVWVSVSASPLMENSDSPSHIVIVQDISAEKNSKEQIERSEARFKSLFEDSPIALWEEDFSQVKRYLWDLGLVGEKPKIVLAYFKDNPKVVSKAISLIKVINVNNECLNMMYPKTREELLAGNFAGIHEDYTKRSFIRQLVAITTGTNLIATDVDMITENGDVRSLHLRWGVMRGFEQSLERVIISTEDITEQKQSQKLISSTQKKIESLVDTIDGIVWECDYHTYAFTFINKKAEEISGYTVAEWQSSPEFWANIIHPDDKEFALQFCMKNSKEKTHFSFEYRMIAKDGSVLWIRDIVKVILEDGTPRSLRGIMIDITKTKEAERDLNSSFELVTEQNKRLHNFSYIVSHNLRSHTANIQSISNLIELADSDEERQELVGMLKTVSGSLNDTMDHLNELLNIKTSIDVITEPIMLRRYISNTLNVLSGQIALKKAQIINEVPESVKVQYNPAYMESILLNLITNALRYSHPGREPVIKILWSEDNADRKLTISDNGIGIDLKRHGEKLFGMYKTFNGNADARGIGLFITRNQIEAMGGQISVDSIPGEGTAFTISFK